MARALSHLHSLIRGSVGGLTYFSNQFHQICMRQRTAPVQPNTAWQTGIRSAFDAAESIWETLTEPERDDWRFYATTCIYPGPAGPYAVPGRQLMVGTLALALYAEGISPGLFNLDNLAPAIAGWFNPGPVTPATYGGLTQGIAVSVGVPTGRSAIAVVDVSIAFNPTRTRFKGPWISPQKTLMVLPPASSTKINIDRPIGTLGKAIFTRTRLFTAEAAVDVDEPHALAFPVYLRHICEVPPVNGNDKPPEDATTPPAAAKKKVANIAK